MQSTATAKLCYLLPPVEVPVVPTSSPATPAAAPEAPGLLPYLHLLWPDLKGRALRETAADSFKVHWTTIYAWIKDGMGRAASSKLLEVQDILQQRGVTVDIGRLMLPSTTDDE